MVLINDDQCIIVDIVSIVGFKIKKLNHSSAHQGDPDNIPLQLIIHSFNKVMEMFVSIWKRLNLSSVKKIGLSKGYQKRNEKGINQGIGLLRNVINDIHFSFCKSLFLFLYTTVYTYPSKLTILKLTIFETDEKFWENLKAKFNEFSNLFGTIPKKFLIIIM